MNLENKKKESILKGIGWLQIIGGLTGLILITKLLLHTGTLSGPLLLIFLTGIGLFIFSLFAGKELLSVNKRNGIILSLINQALQLFQWSFWGYGLSYSSGIQASIGIKSLAMAFNFSAIFSSFDMYISSGNEFYIKVNIIAAILIVFLFYAYKKF